LITTPNSPSIADVLKAKITAQRLGSKTIGVIMNFVRLEKGEVKKDDVMKMLELPVFAAVPFDDEIRKSFMQEKVMPVMVRVPGTPAAVEIQKAAAKLAGLSVKIDETGKKLGFLAKLFAMFKRKPKKSKTAQDKVQEKQEVKKMSESRPFDLLNSSLGKDVLVELKGNLSFRGKLKAFDVHMNLTLEEAEKLENGETKNKYGTILLRGDNVLFISP